MLNTVTTEKLAEQLATLGIKEIGENVYSIQASNGAESIIEVIEVDLTLKTMTVRHQHSVHDLVFKNTLDLVLDKLGIKRKTDTVNTSIMAPMPGKVIDVLIQEGDTVNQGDGILILEAMKMENVLKADRDCVVKSIHAIKGESVEKNELLVELD